MVDQRLINYIKSELSRGIPLQQIKQTLLAHGWPDYEIDEAINLATQQRTFPTTSKVIHEELEKSSKLWIIPVLVVTVIVIVGVFAFLTPTAQKSTKPPASIDCGTDIDCFIAASQNCKPAKVIYTNTVDIFGVKHTTTSYYEIKGLKAGKCTFYLRTEKIDLTFPPETPQDIVEQQKEGYKKLEGRDGTCKFNINDLTAILRKWKAGNFEGSISCTFVNGKWECTQTGDWEVAEDCQGTFFSQEL